jgi:hypothetical protein
VRFADAREMKMELVEKLLSGRPTQFCHRQDKTPALSPAA